ncbi:hypothetical protein ACQ4PT_037995 [Festuca glaucescens]
MWGAPRRWGFNIPTNHDIYACVRSCSVAMWGSGCARLGNQEDGLRKTIVCNALYSSDVIFGKQLYIYKQMCRSEATALKQKIVAVEAYQRKLSGEGLVSWSAQELKELELQLEKSLSNIRQKKEKKMMDQILELREKEEKLLRENSVLREQYMALPLLELATRSVAAAAAAAASSPVGEKQVDEDEEEEEERRQRYMDVETDLVIGRPGTSS